jgi:hypothetical protein
VGKGPAMGVPFAVHLRHGRRIGTAPRRRRLAPGLPASHRDDRTRADPAFLAVAAVRGTQNMATKRVREDLSQERTLGLVESA